MFMRIWEPEVMRFQPELQFVTVLNTFTATAFSGQTVQIPDLTHSTDRLLGARPVGLVLGALVKLRKAIVSFVMSVRMEQLDGF
jgi:hypothetical protein